MASPTPQPFSSLKSVGKLSVPRRWLPKAARLIANVFGGQENIVAVQIGSHDGKTNDPLRPLLLRNGTWGALFVEPLPFLFQRLRRTYRSSPRFRFANVAVAETAGMVPFHYLDPTARAAGTSLPRWHDQTGSLDRAHVAKHFPSDYAALIRTVQVPALPLGRLLEQHEIRTFDILHIDAEGHDWKILRQLDLRTHRPQVILFEHRHLPEEERASALRFLAHDYQVTDLGADYFCVAKPPQPAGPETGHTAS